MSEAALIEVTAHHSYTLGEVKAVYGMEPVPVSPLLLSGAGDDEPIAYLEAQCHWLSEEHSRLLPVEREVESKLLSRLKEMRTALADSRFRRMDISFLKIRAPQQIRIDDAVYPTLVPRFAAFSLDSPTFEVAFRCWCFSRRGDRKMNVRLSFVSGKLHQEMRIWCDLPSHRINPLYTLEIDIPYGWEVSRLSRGYRHSIVHTVVEHVEILDKRRPVDWETREIRISAAFAGAIPDDVRLRLAEYQRNFEELVLIAEVNEWVVNVVPVPQRKDPDPLILGRVGDTWWLLESFDTTVSEEWVRREFLQ